MIAIEVELTPKTPSRLQRLIRAWRYAVGFGVVAEVHYHCAPGQTRRRSSVPSPRSAPSSTSRSGRRCRGEVGHDHFEPASRGIHESLASNSR
jgi:hypothetical protein